MYSIRRSKDATRSVIRSNRDIFFFPGIPFERAYFARNLIRELSTTSENFTFHCCLQEFVTVSARRRLWPCAGE